MECGEDTGFVRAKRKCAKAKTNIRIQKPQQQQQQQQKNISFFSVFDGSCFVVVGRNKMEIHIAGFNRTRVSAQNRRRRLSEQQPKKIILRSACRRACLCRAVPCCHSKLAKTYNFEEAKKKHEINGSQLLLIARFVRAPKGKVRPLCSFGIGTATIAITIKSHH